MIVFGLLLIAVAVGAAAVAVTAPAATARVIEISAVGVNVRASPLAMFLAGAVSVVLLVLGFALISQGTRRKARKRKELRDLRKDQPAAAAGTPPDAEGSHSRSHGPRGDTGTDTTDTSKKDGQAAPTPEPNPGSRPPS